ncbi:MAG: barstar family protein [Hungatella sp.]
MRKVLLDFNPVKSVTMIHEYLKFELEFEDGYGENLDALYDELTSLTEDTCVGFFAPPKEDSALSSYLGKVAKVFRDAQIEDDHLCVIFGELEDNYHAE